MPCLLALLGLVFPRVVIVLLWLFGTYLERAYDTWVLPVLGFFFLPYTTLAYAVVENEALSLLWRVVLLALAVVLDLSGWGAGARSRRR